MNVCMCVCVCETTFIVAMAPSRTSFAFALLPSYVKSIRKSPRQRNYLAFRILKTLNLKKVIWPEFILFLFATGVAFLSFLN